MESSMMWESMNVLYFIVCAMCMWEMQTFHFELNWYSFAVYSRNNCSYVWHWWDADESTNVTLSIAQEMPLLNTWSNTNIAYRWTLTSMLCIQWATHLWSEHIPWLCNVPFVTMRQIKGSSMLLNAASCWIHKAKRTYNVQSWIYRPFSDFHKALKNY